VLAASAYPASAQTDQPAGAIIGKDISKFVSTEVASIIAAGTAGIYTRRRSETGGEPLGAQKSASAVTRYFEGGNRGKSAGANTKKIGVWIQGRFATIENDFVNTKFDGDVLAFVAGADYQLSDRIVAGVTLSYEDVDINTKFNNGTTDSSGIGLGPYLVFRLSERFTVDLNATYTMLGTDTTRTSGAVTGDFDSDRLTLGANLNVSHSVKNFFMNGSLGFLYINETRDSYTESNGTLVPQLDISIGQGRLSALVGYDFGNFQPFVSAQLRHDIWAPGAPRLGSLESPTKDTTGIVLGGGFAFSLSDSINGTVTATTTEGREDLSLYSISGGMRVQF
jgi:hypothetical protein